MVPAPGSLVGMAIVKWKALEDIFPSSVQIPVLRVFPHFGEVSILGIARHHIGAVETLANGVPFQAWPRREIIELAGSIQMLDRPVSDSAQGRKGFGIAAAVEVGIHQPTHRLFIAVSGSRFLIFRSIEVTVRGDGLLPFDNEPIDLFVDCLLSGGSIHSRKT